MNPISQRSSVVVMLATMLIPLLTAGCAGGGDQKVYYPIQQDGKWGYINASGEVVIEPQFDHAGPFHEGRAVIAKKADLEGPFDKLYGYINTSGEVVVEPQYRIARRFSSGLAPVQDTASEEYGYVNTEGKMVISPRFHNAFPFSEGLAAVDTGMAAVDGGSKRAVDSFGYINTEGKMKIEPQFYGARRFSSGLAPVLKGGFMNGKWGYINKKGEVIIEPQYEEARPFANGLAPVQKKEGDGGVLADEYWGYIDKEGTVKIKINKELALPFSNGLAPMKGSSGDAYDPGGKSTWVYVNPSGEHVIEGKWVLAKPFHGELARVALSGVVEQSHTGTHGALSVRVGNDTRHAYINRSGEVVWKETKSSQKEE